MNAPPHCPLCREPETGLLLREGEACYHLCPSCGLAFLHPRQRLRRRDELAHYLTHDNRVDDPRYRAFLDRLAAPLLERLPPGSEGLDFGSGPGPALADMLQQQGHPMSLYDPFFAENPQALRRTYDFITCTETAEHLHDPHKTFGQLNDLLRPAGWLGVMTQILTDPASFESWWYRRDPTHVCFYQHQTMHWLADHFAWQLHCPRANVYLFQKCSAGR